MHHHLTPASPAYAPPFFITSTSPMSPPLKEPPCYTTSLKQLTAQPRARSAAASTSAARYEDNMHWQSVPSLLSMMLQVFGSQVYTRFSPSVISDALKCDGVEARGGKCHTGQLILRIKRLIILSGLWRCCGVEPHFVLPGLQAAAAALNEELGRAKWDTHVTSFR